MSFEESKSAKCRSSASRPSLAFGSLPGLVVINRKKVEKTTTSVKLIVLNKTAELNEILLLILMSLFAFAYVEVVEEDEVDESMLANIDAPPAVLRSVSDLVVRDDDETVLLVSKLLVLLLDIFKLAVLVKAIPAAPAPPGPWG